MGKENYCSEHCEISHTVLGDGKSNKGLVQRVSAIERILTFGFGILAAINFIWVFVAYPWLESIIKMVNK